MSFMKFLAEILAPKTWKVGSHRVKKTEKIRRGTAPHGVSDSVGAIRDTYYKCVDCEKEFKNRSTFHDEECYEVT